MPRHKLSKRELVVLHADREDSRRIEQSKVLF